MMSRETVRPVGIPRWMVLVSAGVLVVSSTVMIWGALASGITWDEFGLAKFLQGYLSNGWFTEPTAVANGIPDLGKIWYLNSYGPVASIPGHWLSVLLGHDSLGHVDLTGEAFGIRHLGTSFFALLGLASVAGTCRIVLKSWSWGLFGAALLASVPLWIGHGMFNSKDVPVAAACTLATMALTGMCSKGSWDPWPAKIGYSFCLFLGLVIGAGTRPFIGLMIVGMAVISLLVKAVWCWIHRSGQFGTVSALVLSGVSAFLAYIALLLIYPKLFSDPLKLGVGAFLEARQFAFNEQVLVAGHWVSEPVPWWYLPSWFAAQLPLLVVIAFLVGLIAWVMTIFPREWRSANHKSDISVELVPALAQALAAMTLAMLSGAVIYNGTRQYLFAVPGFVIVATFGIATAMGKLQTASRLKIALVWCAVAVGVVIPTIAQVQLFPYTYTYFNAAAIAVTPVDGNWPTDYWRSSSRELMTRIPKDGQEICAYESGLWKRKAPCSREQMFLPYLNERGLAASAMQTLSGAVWVVRENQGVVAIPAECRLADEISRRNLWQKSTMAQLLECPNSTPLSVFSYPPSTS